MSEKLRVGVVGTGWWSTTAHIPALKQSQSVELVALCDMNFDKAQTAANEFHVPHVYNDVAEMLRAEKLDGVVVATYHATHYEVAKLCLEHNAHVLIEKPMTLYARDAKTLVELAAARNRQIVMGYNHNFNPVAIHARKVIAEGGLGDIQYVTGTFSQHNVPFFKGTGSPFNITGLYGPGDVYSDPRRSGGGHGHLQMTHLIGMVFFTTGLRAKRVHAVMHNQGLNVDLINAFIVEFENGAPGTLGGTSNVTGGGRVFRLQIYCENGWIDLNEAAGMISIQRDGQPPDVQQPAPGQGLSYLFQASTFNFIDVLTGQAANGSSGDIGWRAVELLDAAYQSAGQNGAGVTVESLYP